MAHLEKDDLYSLFYALALEAKASDAANKGASASGVALSAEMRTAVARFRKAHGSALIPPPSQFTPERVSSVIKHIKNCKSCDMLAIEDGPDAPRPKTLEEIAAEDDALRAEQEKLIRKFWISGSYAVFSLIGAMSCQTIWFLNYAFKEVDTTTVTMQSANQPIPIHPLQILSFIFIFATAWGGATCWQIARENWMDTLRLKAAVPFFGSAWAARTRRKRKLRPAEVGRHADDTS